jgi:hypothetical protein
MTRPAQAHSLSAEPVLPPSLRQGCFIYELIKSKPDMKKVRDGGAGVS